MATHAKLPRLMRLRECAVDGSLRLESELEVHRSGELSCPNECRHYLVFENIQICDLAVEFTVDPQDALTWYHNTPPSWGTGDVVKLSGSSKPRRLRTDSRENQLVVGVLSESVYSPVRHDVMVTTRLRRDIPGGRQGPPQDSVGVTHRLRLSRTVTAITQP